LYTFSARLYLLKANLLNSVSTIPDGSLRHESQKDSDRYAFLGLMHLQRVLMHSTHFRLDRLLGSRANVDDVT
jgi:hypothetical protein